MRFFRTIWIFFKALFEAWKISRKFEMKLSEVAKLAIKLQKERSRK